MTTFEELRHRIDTATDFGAVVKTMKTLAAVSIRQYERAVDALADYSRTIELGFQAVLRDQPRRFDATRELGRTGAVIFGSDQGMCGQFNDEIVSFARRQQRADHARRTWSLLVVGARAEGQALEAGWSVDQTFQVPTSASDITNLVLELLPRVERWRSEADVSRLFVFHNRRTSASSYTPCQLQLLPIGAAQLRQWSGRGWDSNSLPMLASDARRLLSRLVRQYLFVTLFRACAESLASENASRIAAMQAAERNIDDRLEILRRDFYQTRQTAITEELLDVVSGFEALSRQRRATGRKDQRIP